MQYINMPYVVLLTSYQAWLSRSTGRAEIVIWSSIVLGLSLGFLVYSMPVWLKDVYVYIAGFLLLLALPFCVVTLYQKNAPKK